MKFVIIDGHALLYRAYYALPKLTAPDGRPTGGVLGFLKKLLKICREQSPDALVAVFDASGPNFRHELSADYKETRSAMPDDLVPQVGLIQEILPEMGIKTISVGGVEADDVIATLALKAAAQNFQVIIYSGDKDLAALVSENILVYGPARDLDTERILDREGVYQKFGVYPETIPDYLSLVGDTSDNIRGVDGVGPKTAAKLLTQYSSIEGILAASDELTPKLRQVFKDHADSLPITRSLVRLRRDVDLGDPDVHKDFPAVLAPTPGCLKLLEALAFKNLFKETPAVAAAVVEEVAPSIAIPPHLVLGGGDLAEYLNRLGAEIAAVSIETTSLDPHDAEIVGFSFAAAGIAPAYFSFLDSSGRESLGRYFADESAKKCGHDIKYDLQVLWGAGLPAQGYVADMMVIAALLDPLRPSHALDALALDRYGIKKMPFKTLGGLFQTMPVEEAAAYGCESAYLALSLYRDLMPSLKGSPLDRLYHEIEHPLIEVLARMEWQGIIVNRDVLGVLAVEFKSELDRLRAAAIEAAGVSFNPDSPKQIGVILFETLGLPTVRKIKTGYSTDVGTLTELKDLHPLPGLLLEYRELAKLMNTYVLSLPDLINKKTGRIHTSFNQSRTATGRLSSTNPNLQNIPIRTDRGQSIRKAFQAAPGKKLVVADYSQIEFRVVAHLSGDETLLDSFAQGRDLHSVTALKIFGEENPLLRRKAKAVNFGILYGQSAFGLSKTLGISQKEAAILIKAYFEAFPQLKRWMDNLLKDAEEKGYVETLFGRRRPVPELQSKNQNIKSAAARVAINTPVQGTAADIMKIAMITLDRKLPDSAALLLQVHDELVIEAPAENALEVQSILKNEMTNVAGFGGVLEISAGIGDNWLDAA